MALLKYSICTPPETVKAIDTIAKLRRRSRSFIISEAIDEYLQSTETTATETQPRNCKPCYGTGIFTEAGTRRTCNSCYGTGFNEDEVATTTKPKKKAGAR